VVWDDHLSNLGCVYFEAGDHEDLVYMGGAEFRQLLGGAPHCDFAASA
jgi:prolyl-tRNA editing enzyme YbaK/EbsC (Cys-tRNA(Pro) deacylase)